MSLSLRYHPDEVLREVCVDCNVSGDERVNIAQEMTNLMIVHGGLGLSAPQVGLNWRIFVMRDPEDYSVGLTFINPVIVDKSQYEIEELEGCLSIPRNRVKISRASTVELQFLEFTSGNETITRHFKGDYARCIQHEIDHLNGILIFDHIKSKLGKRLFLDKYAKSRKKYARIS